jgi:hypothetical protein
MDMTKKNIVNYSQHYKVEEETIKDDFNPDRRKVCPQITLSSYKSGPNRREPPGNFHFHE